METDLKKLIAEEEGGLWGGLGGSAVRFAMTTLPDKLEFALSILNEIVEEHDINEGFDSQSERYGNLVEAILSRKEILEKHLKEL